MRPAGTVMLHARLVVGLLILLQVSGCAEVDEETRLKQQLESLVGAVEERSTRGVMSHLAEGFQAAKMPNQAKLKSFLRIQFHLNQVIKVYTSNMEIRMAGQSADVLFDALVTGSTSWIPERGRRVHVKTRWVLQQGDWKLSRLAWEKFDN